MLCNLLNSKGNRPPSPPMSSVCSLRQHVAGMAALLGALAMHSTAFSAAQGIQFACSAARLKVVQGDMQRYLDEQGISRALYQVSLSAKDGTLTYTLRTPSADVNTLDLSERKQMNIAWATVNLTDADKITHKVRTVSQKEIALALMQHGRLTVFSGEACHARALQDQIGLRQSIVAWSEHLHWGWPNGGKAQWNTKYWHKGTPKQQWPLDEAMLDVFTNQRQYVIGCYTATKLSVVQGVMSYYRDVRRSAKLSALVSHRLQADGDPLVNIEPGDMWSFESDFDPAEVGRAGKLMKMHSGVAAKNFVPGDWAYIVNTDKATQHKTGYEGSNALYLGRNRFDDYYDDHAHSYTYEEKLGEVYQWRHGVFSRTRDADKVKPLSAADMAQLGLTPEQGGMVLSLRVVPYLFGYEPLPPIEAAGPK